MKTRLMTLIRNAAGIGLLAMLPWGTAQAGSCLAGTTCQFLFNNTNVTGMTVDIEVIINNFTDPAHTIITVNYLGSNLTNTALGIDQFAYGSAGGILPDGTTNGGDPVSTTPSGGFLLDNCSVNNAPCQMDGFGAFDESIADSGGTLLNFTFQLAGVETNFDSTSGDGGEFALHIRFSGGCSAFVADNTAAQNPDANCILAQQAPEPGTLALLGIAIAGLGYARTRMQRRR